MLRANGRWSGLTALLIWLLSLVTGCVQTAPSCPWDVKVDLSEASTYASEDDLPFRFPLDDYDLYKPIFSAKFASFGSTSPGVREYHAAEDVHLPPGTPVFAMADGRISFSGPMSGYGWLIIIDHPQANLYSLYGHLSPSRWKLGKGVEVSKGDLIAYLGDPDENGGSSKKPLRPHLHFGVRAGQRNDYPGTGEARWQAGWIKPCPQDLGWLQPSLVIADQYIPPGGFTAPEMDFLDTWGGELMVMSLYIIGGASSVYFASRSKKYTLLILYGAIAIAAGCIMNSKGMYASLVLVAVGILLLGFGLYNYVQRFFINRREHGDDPAA
jgi:hypothetical protein